MGVLCFVIVVIAASDFSGGGSRPSAGSQTVSDEFNIFNLPARERRVDAEQLRRAWLASPSTSSRFLQQKPEWSNAQ